MVDRSTTIPFSPLRNTSIGFIDEYESGMEASLSSMAEEEEFVEEQQDKLARKLQHPHPHHHPNIPNTTNKKRHVILPHTSSGKLYNSSHRRMSSGNSSTDSNAPTSVQQTKAASTTAHTSATIASTTAKRNKEFTYPLQMVAQNPATSRLSRKTNDVPPTPSSGYDGDTEGPLIEDNN